MWTHPDRCAVWMTWGERLGSSRAQKASLGAVQGQHVSTDVDTAAVWRPRLAGLLGVHMDQLKSQIEEARTEG